MTSNITEVQCHRSLGIRQWMSSPFGSKYVELLKFLVPVLHLFLSAAHPPTSLFPKQRTPLAFTQPALLNLHLSLNNFSVRQTVLTETPQLSTTKEYLTSGFRRHALRVQRGEWKRRERQRGRGGQSGGGEVKRWD